MATKKAVAPVFKPAPVVSKKVQGPVAQTTIQKAQTLLADMKTSLAAEATMKKTVSTLTATAKTNASDAAATTVAQKANLASAQQNQVEIKAAGGKTTAQTVTDTAQATADAKATADKITADNKIASDKAAADKAAADAAKNAFDAAGSNKGGSGPGGSLIPGDPGYVAPTVAALTVTDTFTDPSGHKIAVMSDGTTKDLGTTDQSANLNARQNVFDTLQQQFESFGVLKPNDQASTDLLAQMKTLAMSGAGADSISLALQQSQAYQDRFAGNVARKAQGLSVLSPAEYIATENAYDAVFKAAGVPASFYSGTAEKAALIGNDISASELQSRVDVAAKSIANKDPFYATTLQNYYGLSAGDMIAHALDPQAALPILQQRSTAATFGAAAARQGLSVASSTAEQYGALGVTQSQAEQGFQSIGTQLPEDAKLAQIYGGQFGTPGSQQALLQSATFGGPDAATAQLQLKKLQQQEANAFSGSAGVAKGSLQGDQGGTF